MRKSWITTHDIILCNIVCFCNRMTKLKSMSRIMKGEVRKQLLNIHKRLIAMENET